MPFITKPKVYILDMYRGFIGNDKEEEKMSKTYHIKKFKCNISFKINVKILAIKTLYF